MPWALELLLMIGILAVLLLSGLWIAAALGVTGLIMLYIAEGGTSFPSIANIGFNMFNSFTLAAVPLFIFMGEIVYLGGASRRLFEALDMWTRRLPGGLLHGSIAASGLFAATTGSSVATAAAVGSVALPEIEKRGSYHMPSVCGTLAAGGTLGILIPPSIPLILYGTLENLSISKLFAAALIPGVLLCLSYMVYTYVRVKLVAGVAPATTRGGGLRASLAVAPGVIPVLALIALVLVTVYTGVATPEEAAALGVAGACIIGARALSTRLLYEALKRTIHTSVMVFMIMLGAQILAFALVQTGLSREITQWVVDLALPKAALLAVIVLIYIILGDFIDGNSMMLLTLPLFYPIILAAGFDPIWFGVILVILIELGQITPPVGLNLFVIQGLARRVPHGAIVRQALPFGAIMIGVVVVLALAPDIALWLPRHTSGF